MQVTSLLTRSYFQPISKKYLSTIDKYFYRSVNSSLMQTPQSEDKQFNINYMANFVQFFWNTLHIALSDIDEL